MATWGKGRLRTERSLRAWWLFFFFYLDYLELDHPSLYKISVKREGQAKHTCVEEDIQALDIHLLHTNAPVKVLLSVTSGGQLPLSWQSLTYLIDTLFGMVVWLIIANDENTRRMLSVV